MKRVTIKTIAESLGLSVNTVSRALAGKDAVSEETRQRVRAEADRIGYVPNSMARSLVLGAAMTIGMVITHPSNPFYATLISAVEARCRANGYSLLLLATEEDLEAERAAAEALLRWGVDGAIVFPVQQGSEHWRRLRDSGVPIVLMNRNLPDMDCDFVGVDYEDGGYQATRHALSGGAGTIHVIEEDLPLSSVTDRIAGFRRALSERPEPVADTVALVPAPHHEAQELPWEPADAYHLAQALVTELAERTVVMAGTDYFALGVYRAAAEAGVRIPDDLEVLGFGDHPFSAYLNPPLTSVRLPAAQVGRTAVDLLLRRVDGASDDTAVESIQIKPSLVIRSSSTGAARPGSPV